VKPKAGKDVVVLGAGAMGCLLAGLTARSRRSVALVDVVQEKVDALGSGIRFSGVEGEFVVPVEATSDSGSLAPPDFLLFCVKAYDTRAAASQHAHLAGPQTLVITLQNGLGNIEAISDSIDPGRLLAGTTSLGANMIEPGHVHFAGRGKVELGELDGTLSDRLERSAALFRDSGVEVELSRDVQALLWSKLVVNVGINALTALLDVRNGVLLELPAARELMGRAVGEAVQVASRCGVVMNLDEAVAHVEAVARATARNRSSMLADVSAGRPTEVDQINGAVVERAAQHGIDAPVNEVLTRLAGAKARARSKNLTEGG
jgi:2-dehydropantoate 2-reductase